MGAWWSGCDIVVDKKTMHIDTLYDCLNDMCSPPGRNETAAMRMPVSGIYKIKVVGDVIAGRIEQGLVKPNEEVIYMPTHTPANACGGKVFTIEMHHTRHEVAKPGDNVGLNIKGLDKQNMPRVGDVMIYKKDTTLDRCGQFTAQIQTLDIPGEIKIGYSPIGFVRCGRSACRATAFNFKVGKETGGKKMDSPHSLKSNEMAEVVFVPQQPLVVDSFKNCEGLSRIAFLDGNTAVMLGKVTALKYKKDMPPDETGKKKKKTENAPSTDGESSAHCAARALPLAWQPGAFIWPVVEAKGALGHSRALARSRVEQAATLASSRWRRELGCVGGYKG